MFDSLTRLGASGGEEAYEIGRSLRFNSDDSAYLTWDPSSAGSRRTWTFSFWTKIAAVGHQHCFFSIGPSSTARVQFMLESNGKLNLETNNNSGTPSCQLLSSARFTDISAWYHIVVKLDTENGTAANRAKIFVNGVDIVDQLGTANYPAEDDDLYMGLDNGNPIYIGKRSYSSTYLQGYMAEFHYIDGTALDADSFGKTDPETGKWIPIEYTGSHGTNGSYLNFSDNSNTTSGTLGDDDSANTNDWTPNNFSVAAGFDNDSMLDTPTNNYCVLDSKDVYDPGQLESSGTGARFTNGALQTNAPSGSGNAPIFSTIGLKSGKWYCEAKLLNGWVGCTLWLMPKDHDATSRDLDASSWSSNTQNGKGYSLLTQYGNAYHSSVGNVLDYVADGSQNDVYMMAVDLDAGKLWWGKNGTWGDNGGTGNPATGANAAFTNVGSVSGQTNETWCFGGNDVNQHHLAFNFGQQGFTYTPPTGFKDVCEQNLPEPSIKDPSKYFNTVLYTGNDSDGHAITGVGFQPNLVWIKDRGDGNKSRVYDSIRGVNAAIHTDDTSTEDQFATYGQFESFDSDGFTVGIGTGTSGQRGEGTNSAEPHVAWCWKETAAAGFDIVSYTGTGSNPQTRAHSLGVAPEMIILKNRSGTNGDEHWAVYHHKSNADAEDYWGRLNTTGAFENLEMWNDTVPTSSVFTTQNHAISNYNGDTFIAYLFASVEGYSKVGYYFGNGQQEGPFVYTGFKPAWVLIKNVEEASVWNLHDNKRNPFNIVNKVLYPSENDDEEAYNVDNAASTNKNFYANGFQIYSTHDPEMNANDERYIYLAFAESPFKYSNAR